MNKPNFPAISPESLEHSQRCANHIKTLIAQSANQQISFKRFMHEALYAAGLGYYTAGNTKLSNSVADSDFTTAPELSPWFGRTWAKQINEILQNIDSTHILEFGAGTGKLAYSILETLVHDTPTLKYFILEVSPDLRQRQEQTLKDFASHIVWLDTLPTQFEGCVIANEVLDAMPVNVYAYDEHESLSERYVSVNDQGQFFYCQQAPNPDLIETIGSRMPALPNYYSEINFEGQAWIKTMAQWLHKGVAIFIDYGFPQHEYYHPQRSEGTIMCHLRHHSHPEALLYPGIQDITAHVDFTAMADAAYESGFDILGFTSQAHFLMNLGLLDELAVLDSQSMVYIKQITNVQKLLSEAEMGELFKVLAIGKDYSYRLNGFSHGNRIHKL